MFMTPVPEAAVNEHREFGSREDDVGADRPTLGRHSNRVVDSKAKAQGKESGSKSLLGSSVAPAIALHCGAHRRTRGHGRGW